MGLDTSPFAYVSAITVRASSSRWLKASHRGDSGTNGRTAIQIIEKIPCISDGVRQDHVELYWIVL